MLGGLKIKKEYTIAFKRKIFSLFTLNKYFYIEPYISKVDSYQEEYQLKRIKHFSMFNIKVGKVPSYREIILKDMKYINTCNLWIYSVDIDNTFVNILEIMDIDINKKYRGLGIGTKLMNIIESISIENNVEYIIGELQADSKDEPLYIRKNFFVKNGFEVIQNENSKLSGYIIKKTV